MSLKDSIVIKYTDKRIETEVPIIPIYLRNNPFLIDGKQLKLILNKDYLLLNHNLKDRNKWN